MEIGNCLDSLRLPKTRPVQAVLITLIALSVIAIAVGLLPKTGPFIAYAVPGGVVFIPSTALLLTLKSKERVVPLKPFPQSESSTEEEPEVYPPPSLETIINERLCKKRRESTYLTLFHPKGYENKWVKVALKNGSVAAYFTANQKAAKVRETYNLDLIKVPECELITDLNLKCYGRDAVVEEEIEVADPFELTEDHLRQLVIFAEQMGYQNIPKKDLFYAKDQRIGLWNLDCEDTNFFLKTNNSSKEKVIDPLFKKYEFQINTYRLYSGIKTSKSTLPISPQKVAEKKPDYSKWETKELILRFILKEHK